LDSRYFMALNQLGPRAALITGEVQAARLI
jgi:hypothetical protein